MTIFAVVNQKGGVGKTTTAVNLAAIFAKKAPTLLIDVDPQGNATSGSGIEKTALSASTKEVLEGTQLIEEVLIDTDWHYSVLPSSEALTASAADLLSRENNVYQLHSALQSIQGRYQYIFIDCPPAVNMLTLNGLMAAQYFLIPTQCEYYALEGLASLMQTVNALRKTHPNLQLSGIIRTLYDRRNRLSKEVSQQLEEHFPSQLYKTHIPRNIRLAEAPSHGEPISYYAPLSSGREAYEALAQEIMLKHS